MKAIGRDWVLETLKNKHSVSHLPTVKSLYELEIRMIRCRECFREIRLTHWTVCREDKVKVKHNCDDEAL